MKHVAATLSGLLFGLGLAISGMVDPAKVAGFLDFFGAFDPTLMFVMAGAIATHASLNRWVLRRPRPVFAADHLLPTRRDIDGRLVGGAAVFGLGWGFGGYCPGPGIVSLAAPSGAVLAFVGTMLVGMALHTRVARRRLRPVVRHTVQVTPSPGGS